MVTSPDKSRVIAGGSFATINGDDAYGMGALDAATGANLPWAANARIRAAGLNGAISSSQHRRHLDLRRRLRLRRRRLIRGHLRGGPEHRRNQLGQRLPRRHLRHLPGGLGRLYSVGHDHNCTVVGGFPDTSPRVPLAEGQSPSGSTRPAPSPRRTPTAGTSPGCRTPVSCTGTRTWSSAATRRPKQAAWSITGNGDYLVLGGEFPTVNGVAQQGLVRFAKRADLARMKPIATTAFDPDPDPDHEAGAVRVVFGAIWDRDDTTTTYDVFRGVGARRRSRARSPRSDSDFWKLPSITYTDTGVVRRFDRCATRSGRGRGGNVPVERLVELRHRVRIAPSAYANAVRPGCQPLLAARRGAGSTLARPTPSVSRTALPPAKPSAVGCALLNESDASMHRRWVQSGAHHDWCRRRQPR